MTNFFPLTFSRASSLRDLFVYIFSFSRVLMIDFFAFWRDWFILMQYRGHVQATQMSCVSLSSHVQFRGMTWWNASFILSDYIHHLWGSSSGLQRTWSVSWETFAWGRSTLWPWRHSCTSGSNGGGGRKAQIPEETQTAWNSLTRHYGWARDRTLELWSRQTCVIRRKQCQKNPTGSVEARGVSLANMLQAEISTQRAKYLHVFVDVQPRQLPKRSCHTPNIQMKSLIWTWRRVPTCCVCFSVHVLAGVELVALCTSLFVVFLRLHHFLLYHYYFYYLTTCYSNLLLHVAHF